MNLRYYLGAIMSFPLLPLIYYQGKKIKASIPKLPEATGISGSIHVKDPKGNSLRLITLGESTIAGVGVETHEEGFTGTLAKELSRLMQVNVDWKVYARGGYTAKKVTQKLLPKIEESEADLVVIGLGANDAFHLNTPRKWGMDIQTLIEKLQAQLPTAYIVFCNMPPIKEFPAFTPLIKFTIGNLVEILGKELASVVKSYDQVYYCSEIITVAEWIEKLPIGAQKSDFFSDGVHPSKLTYQTWAKDTAVRIANRLETFDETQRESVVEFSSQPKTEDGNV